MEIKRVIWWELSEELTGNIYTGLSIYLWLMGASSRRMMLPQQQAIVVQKLVLADVERPRVRAGGSDAIW